MCTRKYGPFNWGKIWNFPENIFFNRAPGQIQKNSRKVLPPDKESRLPEWEKYYSRKNMDLSKSAQAGPGSHWEWIVFEKKEGTLRISSGRPRPFFFAIWESLCPGQARPGQPRPGILGSGHCQIEKKSASSQNQHRLPDWGKNQKEESAKADFDTWQI